MMPDGELWFNNRSQEKVKIESLLTHRSWRKCIACLQGLWGGQAEFKRAGEDRQDPGHSPLLGSMGGVLDFSG